MDLFDAIFGEEDEAAAPEENTQSAAQPISALHQMEAERMSCPISARQIKANAIA